MNKDKMGDTKCRGPILSRQKQIVIVTDIKIANYMIDQGCSMIALDGAPETLKEVRMIFRGKNVKRTFIVAQTCTFPALTNLEFKRIRSMLALLACVEDAKMKEAEAKL